MDVTSVATQVSDFATSGASSAWLLAGNFVILLALFVVMLLFSYKAGRGGIISLLVAFYAGYAIYMVFPYTAPIVAAGGTPLVKAAISILIFAVATYIPFHFVQRLSSGGFGVLSVFPRFLLSFLAAAFLLALAYHVFDISDIYAFPAPIDQLFAPQGYFFWWFIAPLVGLLFLVH